MAAFARGSQWGEAKPLLERGVTIKLNDDSQIELNREIASKFETIRTVIGYGGIEVGKKEDIIKIFDYPAQYVRHYFQLVEKIDEKKELPNIHFTQLFDFFLVAHLMGNETSMTNLADYIFATALANQSATKEVRAAMREIYSSYPAGPKRFIMNRLAKLNHTISLKSLRNLDMRFINDVRPIAAIDNQGRIVTRELSKTTKKWLYYDETDPQREKLINHLQDKEIIDGIQIGGGTNQGITVVTRHYDQNSKKYVLYGYPPGQLKGKHLISFDSSFKWEIFPFASRFKMEKRISGMYGERNIWIYDLADGSLIFSYIGLFSSNYTTDDSGRYFLITNTNMQTSPDHIEAKLFSVGEMVRGTNGKLTRQNRKLFEVKIPGHDYDESIVDSYRRLIYIFDYYSHRTQMPLRAGEEEIYQGGIRILLVIDFSGQVLHRYIYWGVVNIFPSAKHLLTNEFGRGMPILRLKFARLFSERDLQYIFRQEAVSNEVSQEMKKLPNFELWPTTSVEGIAVDSVGPDNLWIRDATKGFKIAALVKKNYGEVDHITSSPSGSIIVLPPGYVPPGALHISSVMQTVLYSDHELEIINEVLSGPTKGSGEVVAEPFGS